MKQDELKRIEERAEKAIDRQKRIEELEATVEKYRRLEEAGRKFVNVVEIESHTDAYPKYLTKYRAALDGWRYALAALEVK